MKQREKIIWLSRCLGYSFAINVLACIVMLLYANSVIKDITSLIILIAIYFVSAPLYFVVKGDSHKPLLYNLSAIIAHVVFSFITISALGIGICIQWLGNCDVYVYGNLYSNIFCNCRIT